MFFLMNIFALIKQNTILYNMASCRCTELSLKIEFYYESHYSFLRLDLSAVRFLSILLMAVAKFIGESLRMCVW